MYFTMFVGTLHFSSGANGRLIDLSPLVDANLCIVGINCNETSKISKKTSYLKKTKKAGNLIYLEESVQTVKFDMVDLSQPIAGVSQFLPFVSTFT